MYATAFLSVFPISITYTSTSPFQSPNNRKHTQKVPELFQHFFHSPLFFASSTIFTLFTYTHLTYSHAHAKRLTRAVFFTTYKLILFPHLFYPHIRMFHSPLSYSIHTTNSLTKAPPKPTPTNIPRPV